MSCVCGVQFAVTMQAKEKSPTGGGWALQAVSGEFEGTTPNIASVAVPSSFSLRRKGGQYYFQILDTRRKLLKRFNKAFTHLSGRNSLHERN